MTTYNIQGSDPMNPVLLQFRSAQFIQEGGLEPRLISSYHMIVAKQTECYMTLDLQEKRRLSQEAVYIAAPGQTVAIHHEEGKKLNVFLIEFDVHQPGDSTPDFLLAGDIPVRYDLRLIQYCEHLCECSQSGRSTEWLHGQSILYELLYWIMTHRPDNQGSLDSRASMERTKAYIDTNYGDSLNLEQLAQMAGISPKYYGSLFKKMFGKTAIDYLTEVRIRNAKRLMMQSDLRLRDVAFKVGYHDEFYFSRMFKREVGVSPTAYLKNRSHRIAAYSAPILGQLLTLQIIPYAAPLHPKWTSYYYDKYRSEIPLHLSGFRFNEDWESNLQALAGSEVSVIITTDQLHPHEKERLEHIAPVHMISSYEATWREQLQSTARIVGASDKAEAWLDGYDRKAAVVREKLQDQMKEELVLIVSQFKDGYHIFPTRGMKEVIYGDLQMKAPEEAHGYAIGQKLSLEQIASMDADHLLLNICQESETLHHWAQIQTSALWRNMKAVRTNKVHLISSDPWREYSAYASERMINDLHHQLCGNCT
ncbi:MULTISPECIES: AraC family transcriptional regulator [Paenibacillus]|uniref:AraC family transcriptional regulator n=1 Tax=Paenibacillus TaxID=44249 RepID=UPI0022B8958E|nr:AraC family transcriptional regulator [Paenibacillus caseinilyticus]MCZ8519588.1 AraC family transcriptional regulator [Paenibacillus caseinilyticus]